MASHEVRTTLRPGKVITVGDAELLDLQRMSILVKPSGKAAKGEAVTDAGTDSEGASA
jgi:hypothetical protein